MWPTRETCTHSGTFSASFGTHDEISQVPTVPTDAWNATILELSADMIPNPGAFVRQNFIFSAVSPLEPCRLSHEAQGKPCLYPILPERGHISRGILWKCCGNARGRRQDGGSPYGRDKRGLSRWWCGWFQWKCCQCGSVASSNVANVQLTNFQSHP